MLRKPLLSLPLLVLFGCQPTGSVTPESIGAAPDAHSHTAVTLDSLGAAAEDHTHPLPTAEEIGAAADDHTHTLEALGAAADDHTHTLEALGAAADDHTHTPEAIGAAAAQHSHPAPTPEEIGAALAEHDHTTPPPGAQACPVGNVNANFNGIDEEFGDGVAALTRCVQHQTNVKVVLQINQYCKDTGVTNDNCTAPFALGNIKNLLDDYEITHGMTADDYEVAVIVHGPGGPLLKASDKFAGQVTALMDRGVDFYFCQNTVRKMISTGALPDAESGGVLQALIPGVQFTTAGVSSLVDMQKLGYMYLQP